MIVYEFQAKCEKRNHLDDVQDLKCQKSPRNGGHRIENNLAFQSARRSPSPACWASLPTPPPSLAAVLAPSIVASPPRARSAVSEGFSI